MRNIYLKDKIQFMSFKHNIKIKGKHALELHQSIRVPRYGDICAIKIDHDEIYVFSRGIISCNESKNLILFTVEPPILDQINRQKRQLIELFSLKIKDYFQPIQFHLPELDIEKVAQHITSFVKELLDQFKNINSISTPSNQLTIDDFAKFEND